ncbi:T9SS type A sorting domain-containing protein [Aurantibacillus circumpalustris]|uniref:T9SS type A sorting domain-containing protein n=1 Tax=Aurantibacillus circumpalustris TaxID=3036359 RepID=UPI00295BA9BC|nr:T9SS type A sorting domain-containing protein [Aurantibacillus circumpalustris]
MKKILLLSTIGLAVNVFAQSTIELKDMDNNVTLSPNAIINAVTSAGNSKHINLDIKNTGSTTQSYNVKRYNITLNNDAVAYFCFAGTCYGDQTFFSPTSLTLTAGQNASGMPGSFNNLTAYLDEGSVVGYSEIKYSFINAANSSDSIQVTMKYNAAGNTVGVKESFKSLNAFGIFPNPAKETTAILVNTPKTMEAGVQVFNSLGELVYQKNVTLFEGKNKIDVNVESFNTGVYFANLKTEGGNISKKLIISR